MNGKILPFFYMLVICLFVLFVCCIFFSFSAQDFPQERRTLLTTTWFCNCVAFIGQLSVFVVHLTWVFWIPFDSLSPIVLNLSLACFHVFYLFEKDESCRCDGCWYQKEEQNHVNCTHGPPTVIDITTHLVFCDSGCYKRGEPRWHLRQLQLQQQY